MIIATSITLGAAATSLYDYLAGIAAGAAQSFPSIKNTTAWPNADNQPNGAFREGKNIQFQVDPNSANGCYIGNAGVDAADCYDDLDPGDSNLIPYQGVNLDEIFLLRKGNPTVVNVLVVYE